VHALSIELVAAVTRQATPPRWNAAWTVLDRIAADSALDIATMAAINLVHCQPRGCTPNSAASKFMKNLRDAGMTL
jgi:hypothetical protein